MRQPTNEEMMAMFLRDQKQQLDQRFAPPPVPEGMMNQSAPTNSAAYQNFDAQNARIEQQRAMAQQLAQQASKSPGIIQAGDIATAGANPLTALAQGMTGLGGAMMNRRANKGTEAVRKGGLEKAAAQRRITEQEEATRIGERAEDIRIDSEQQKIKNQLEREKLKRQEESDRMKYEAQQEKDRVAQLKQEEADAKSDKATEMAERRLKIQEDRAENAEDRYVSGEVRKLSTDLTKAGIPALEAAIGEVDEMLSAIPEGEGVPGIGGIANTRMLGGPATWSADTYNKIMGNPANAKALRQRWQKLLNMVLKAESGAAVTISEADRQNLATGNSLWGDDDAMREGFQSIKNITDQLRSSIEGGYDSEIVDEFRANRDARNQEGSAPKTVVRTGKMPDGRKVVQYSDGTQEIIE